jgi:hypothetical protein
MKEFMLLIRNEGDEKSAMPPQTHQKFIKACEHYIDTLKSDSKLIASQPLVREGVRISGSKSGWKETPIDPQKEIQVGYYHILAADMDEAIAIAKGNPEFEFSATATIEVRPIKMSEKTTGFVYPR